MRSSYWYAAENACRYRCWTLIVSKDALDNGGKKRAWVDRCPCCCNALRTCQKKKKTKSVRVTFSRVFFRPPLSYLLMVAWMLAERLCGLPCTWPANSLPIVSHYLQYFPRIIFPFGHNFHGSLLFVEVQLENYRRTFQLSILAGTANYTRRHTCP